MYSYQECFMFSADWKCILCFTGQNCSPRKTVWSETYLGRQQKHQTLFCYLSLLRNFVLLLVSRVTLWIRVTKMLRPHYNIHFVEGSAFTKSHPRSNINEKLASLFKEYILDCFLPLLELQTDSKIEFFSLCQDWVKWLNT